MLYAQIPAEAARYSLRPKPDIRPHTRLSDLILKRRGMHPELLPAVLLLPERGFHQVSDRTPASSAALQASPFLPRARHSSVRFIESCSSFAGKPKNCGSAGPGYFPASAEPQFLDLFISYRNRYEYSVFSKSVFFAVQPRYSSTTLLKFFFPRFTTSPSPES